MNRSRSLSLVIQQHARCIRATIFPGFPTSSSHPFAVWQSVHPHCCWQRSNRRCGGYHAVHMVRFRPSPSSPATPSTCFRRKLQPDFRVSTKARENSYDVGLSLRCPKRTTTTTESVREWTGWGLVFGPSGSSVYFQFPSERLCQGRRSLSGCALYGSACLGI